MQYARPTKADYLIGGMDRARGEGRMAVCIMPERPARGGRRASTAVPNGPVKDPRRGGIDHRK